MPPNQAESGTPSTKHVEVFICDQNVPAGKKGKNSHDEQVLSSPLQTFNDGLSSLSSWVSSTLEQIFEAHGQFVSEHPLKVIFTCLVITAITSIGLMRFHTEIRPYKLWLAQDSNFIKGLEWQQENFPLTYRQNKIIWESENILTAASIQSMWLMHKRINSTRDPVYGKSWNDICLRVPSLSTGRRRTSGRSNTDRSMLYDRQFYCSTIEFLKKKCFEKSLLEVWGLDGKRIMNLTDTQVLEDVNSATVSKVFGFDTPFENYLGGIERNSAGDIISAKAALHTWTAQINETMLAQGTGTFDPGTGMEVDLINLSFESAWVDAVLNQSGIAKGVKAYANAASSFGIISEANINGDIPWVALGFSLMFMFVTVAIGRRNFVEQRPLLAAAGIFSISQAVIISYGICSAFGVFYCPVNSILPVLMVGLGVDDMFVLMSSWESLHGKDFSQKSRLALTMRHAGVSITVTSLTDVVAFAVGSTTSLPALGSFCTYAAVGVLAVYLMQITFFASFIIFDQKRIDARRNAVAPCIVHENWSRPSYSETDLVSSFFKNYYIPAILSKVGKAVVMVLAVALIGVSAYGTANLHHQFDPMWFLPSESYLAKWHDNHQTYFPENINTCFIFISPVQTSEDILKADQLLDSLEELPFVHRTSPAIKDFVTYFDNHPAYENDTLNTETFEDVLSLFLNSRSGASYMDSFHFENKLACNETAPPIKTLRLPIQLSDIHVAHEQAEAMKAIDNVLSSFRFPGYLNSWAESYVVWETNEIVGAELASNLTIVTTIIFLVTLLLLASVGVALLVLGCVMCTILCITGLMWYWGLTIDTVSCIAIVLSVGLSIDYAVHIAHAYLVNARNKVSLENRVEMAVENVGPAVLLGGLSTLITFLLMAPSTSHVFHTFYKIFVGSATFGLFWGLAVLPVLLVVISSFFGKSSSKYEIGDQHVQGQENASYSKTET